MLAEGCVDHKNSKKTKTKGPATQNGVASKQHEATITWKENEHEFTKTEAAAAAKNTKENKNSSNQRMNHTARFLYACKKN